MNVVRSSRTVVLVLDPGAVHQIRADALYRLFRKRDIGHPGIVGRFRAFDHAFFVKLTLCSAKRWLAGNERLCNTR